MAKKILAIELRVPPATARFGLAALLVSLCDGPTLTQNVEFSTQYLAPAGVYSGITVGGIDGSGNVNHTVLNPVIAGLGTPQPVGIRTGSAALPANTGTAVSPTNMMLYANGRMVVGGNAPSSVGLAVHSAPLDSGMTLVDRGGAPFWNVFPDVNGNLELVSQTGNGMVLQSNGKFQNACYLSAPYGPSGGAVDAQCNQGDMVLTTITISNHFWSGLPIWGAPWGIWWAQTDWYTEFPGSATMGTGGSNAEMRRVAIAGRLVCCRFGAL